MSILAEANQKVVDCSKTTAAPSSATIEMAKPLQAGTTTG
jgi:hypothetical protein